MKIKQFIILFLIMTVPASIVFAEMNVDVKVGAAIVDREPQQVGATFPADTAQLVGWCRVKNATEPVEIYHRWRLGGKDVALVKLPVRSSNYRVWSFLAPKGRTGAWTLEVLDWDKNVLATTSFNIQ